MPLPTPQGDETRQAFMSRCMADPEMRGEFPTIAQRAAVCAELWRANADTRAIGFARDYRDARPWLIW